jgi:hypothetical protein
MIQTIVGLYSKYHVKNEYGCGRIRFTRILLFHNSAKLREAFIALEILRILLPPLLVIFPAISITFLRKVCAYQVTGIVLQSISYLKASNKKNEMVIR